MHSLHHFFLLPSLRNVQLKTLQLIHEQMHFNLLNKCDRGQNRYTDRYVLTDTDRYQQIPIEFYLLLLFLIFGYNTDIQSKHIPIPLQIGTGMPTGMSAHSITGWYLAPQFIAVTRHDIFRKYNAQLWQWI